MPLCFISYSNMFPRSYNSFDSGSKLPLVGTWPESPKLNVSLVGATTSPKLPNPSSSFAIPKVLLEILNAIDVNPNEVFPEILDFITIDLVEIVELSNSQFIPKLTPRGKNKSLMWMALGRSFAKNHMIIVESYR